MQLSNRLRRGIALLAASLVAPATASSLMIDAFDSGSMNFIGPGATVDVHTTGAMIGGARDERLTNLSPSGGILAGMSASQYEYGAVNAAGSALLVWDGLDRSPTIDATGLGGIDFTEGGANDLLAIEIASNDFVADLVLRVYTSDSDFSEAVVSTPGGIPGGPAILLTVAFADFLPLAGLGVDFTDVGALSLTIDGSSDPQLGVTIGAVQATSLAQVPEPAPVVLILLGLTGFASLRRVQPGWL